MRTRPPKSKRLSVGLRSLYRRRDRALRRMHASFVAYLSVVANEADGFTPYLNLNLSAGVPILYPKEQG